MADTTKHISFPRATYAGLGEVKSHAGAWQITFKADSVKGREKTEYLNIRVQTGKPEGIYRQPPITRGHFEVLN